jgi:molybdopterin-guanine dinucleotide biosynthesis protein A
MGGGKPARELAGRPLVAWPAAALAAACERVVVVAKPEVELPPLPGVERWDEPDPEHHPARGIAYALERAGEPVLVCAADMPFLTPAACRAVAEGLGEGVAAVAVADGVMQPVFAAYAPAAAEALRAAPPDAALTRTVDGLAPALVDVEARLVRSVNSEEDLARAEVELGLRGA